MLLLRRKRERVFEGLALCVEGYTTIHSLAATVVPKLLMAGSCKATMSMPRLASATLEIRACWQICDLLTFCCQIFILFELLAVWFLWAVVLVVLIIISNWVALGCSRSRGSYKGGFGWWGLRRQH